jgi:hypothetical protein
MAITQIMIPCLICVTSFLCNLCLQFPSLLKLTKGFLSDKLRCYQPYHEITDTSFQHSEKRLVNLWQIRMYRAPCTDKDRRETAPYQTDGAAPLWLRSPGYCGASVVHSVRSSVVLRKASSVFFSSHGRGRLLATPYMRARAAVFFSLAAQPFCTA